MFAGLKKKLAGGASRVSGRTDLLEAVCASAALVAAADGNISDEEVGQAITVVTNNELLSSAFDARTIEAVMDKMLARAKGGFSGRAGLMKEIADIADKSAEDAEMVYLIALDVAYADGDVGDKEREQMGKIAKSLKVDPSKFE
jgi:tellurite resistance protein